MTIIFTAVAGATAGAAAWLIAPWASMAVHGTVDQRQREHEAARRQAA